MFSVALLQLAGREVYNDPRVPDVMENIGDDGVGILLFLGLIELVARLSDQPGTERAEHEELLPRVGLQDKVVPGWRQFN